MTTHQDPPRLRSLGAQLPNALVLALRAPGETATPADVAELARRVRAATAPHDSDAPVRPIVPRRRAARGRAASLVLAFSLGAAAGVTVFSGAFIIERRRSSNLIERAGPVVRAPPSPSAPAVAPPLQASATPERMLDVPPEPPPRRPVELSRIPQPTSALELPSAAPSGSRAVSQQELALLARAQGALGGEPARALALTSEHERRFPQGALAQEREVVAMDALLRLGRRGEAAARAARFQRQFPSSVHARRLDVLLGAGGGSGRDHN